MSEQKIQMDLEEKIERRLMLEKLMRYAEKKEDKDMILRLCNEFNSVNQF